MTPWVVLSLSVVFAALFSFLLVSLFGWRRGGRGPAMSSILFLFAILFLAIWAAGLWLQPFGPTAWGVSWVPLVIVGLVVSLLIAATSPPRPGKDGAKTEVVGESVAEAALNAFFWMLLLVLVVVIIASLV